MIIWEVAKPRGDLIYFILCGKGRPKQIHKVSGTVERRRFET